MTPADCRPGIPVWIGTPSRVWEVRSAHGNWAELLHPESGERVETTVSLLVRADRGDGRTAPTAARVESHRTRPPSALCWVAIAMALAFVVLHAWVAIRIGRSVFGLDPTSSAVAIAIGGAGWAAWFLTMLWVVWRRS